MTLADVTPCLVTRGNVDITEILESWAEAELSTPVVWNNADRDNHGVYGRYLAVEEAAKAVVFVQDDDCLLNPEDILRIVDAYEPGRIVANMPQPHRKNYSDSCLVGFGAVFDRYLPERAFARFRGNHRQSPDVVFTALTPFTLVDVPVENLPWAYGEDRMYRQPNHVRDRFRVLQQARAFR